MSDKRKSYAQSTELESGTSEISQEPIPEERVIIARERAKRPGDFVHRRPRRKLPDFSHSYHFCPGKAVLEETAGFMRNVGKTNRPG